MGDWDGLLERVREADRARRARRQRRWADHARASSFDRWCDEVTDLVLRAVRDHAVRRAEEFERVAGRVVEVRYPSRPQAGEGGGGPCMRFLQCSLEGAVLQLYSHRAPGTLPVLHWGTAETAAPPARRGRRGTKPLVAEPAPAVLRTSPSCVIARLPGDAFELQVVRHPDEKGPPVVPISVDDVVYWAFRMLVEAALSRAPGG